ncbi:hypothetical protein M2175_002297 [Bradyrhizobium elkanii]|nr:hypothetical protein [Bradyrhizobium elkanii]MCS3967819.1 hypothetical protein [Bradyrhizobium japonicum]
MCVIFEPRPSSAGELPACKAKSAGMATGIMHTRRKADCRAGAGDRSPGWSAARSGTARPAPTPFPDCAEPVIGRRFASTRWLHPGDGALVARRAKHPRGRQAARAKIFHFTEIRKWRMCRPSRLILEGRSCVVTVASRACGGRDSVGRERSRAGRIALREPRTSCRMSGAVRFVSSVSFRLRRQGRENCGEMAGRAYGKTVWSWPSLLRSSALRMRQSRQPARCR